jgi:hypothetical protein
MMTKFSFETRKALNRQQKTTIEWLNARALEAIKGGFRSYMNEKKVFAT